MNSALNNKIDKQRVTVGTAQPLVSVIMPSYNSEKFIMESVDSIREQRNITWELLIVDDGSTDRTVDLINKVVESDSRIRLIEMSENSGPAVARNVGIDEASGEFIAFLDSDDLLSREGLAIRAEALKGDRWVAGSYCDMVSIDENASSLGDFRMPAGPVTFFDLIENKFPTSLVMLRRSILRSEGSFDTTLRHGEDWDLWLRLARAGYSFVRASGCNVFHRQHHSSLTHDHMLEDFKQRVCVLEKSWSFDENCNNPLDDFKDGLGGALKAKYRTIKAFVIAMGELALGKRESASDLMKYVSLDILPLLNSAEVAGGSRFWIKRNLCMDEKEWMRQRKELWPLFDDFFRSYQNEKTEMFFKKLSNNLFSVGLDDLKSDQGLLHRLNPKVVMNKILGLVYLILSGLADFVGRLYRK